MQTPAIKERRGILGLNKDTSETHSIQYLESLSATESMSVDALYTLGYSYWRQHKWEKGVETLSKALEKISSSTETSFNGRSKEELAKNIKQYLELCRKELN